MLTVNIVNDSLTYKDIKKSNLNDLLNLYNCTEENIYATGIDRHMTYSDINQKYLEVLVNRHEFYVGIFHSETDILIGAIKGRIDYENIQEAWIMSLLIQKKYQGLGIGKKAVDNMIHYLNKNYDIQTIFTGIISGNSDGKAFWQKSGFNPVRTIEQYIELNGCYKDYIILRKDIFIN